MSNELLDFLFALVFTSIFLITMLILTFIGIKFFLHYKINKKNLENSKFLLNDGWKVLTTNNNGIPILFQKDKKFISISEIKSIKAIKDAKI